MSFIAKGVTEFPPETVTEMVLSGKIMFDDTITASIIDAGVRIQHGDLLRSMSFDDFIFQPACRKEILYDIVKIDDKYYLNIWGGRGYSDKTPYVLVDLDVSPDQATKYMNRLSRLKHSLF